MPKYQSTPDPDFERITDLLLGIRLRELEGAFERTQEEVAGGSAGSMDRWLLVNAWVEVLDGHCDAVVRDLIRLMTSFEELAAAEWLLSKIGDHVDDAVAALLQALSECQLAGMSSVAGERKRVTNRVSGIKARSHDRLRERIARARATQCEVSSLEASADELDDRLPVRRAGAFDRDIREMVDTARRAGQPLSLVMIDLDHFKSVNDQHGHPVGDEVLVEVAERVVDRVAGKGKAYRYGGEEFAVLLPSYSAEEAAGLAERLRKDLAEAPMSSHGLAVTASFGVTCVDGAEATARTLLERADGALYTAKREGRNRVRVVDELGAISWSLG